MSELVTGRRTGKKKISLIRLQKLFSIFIVSAVVHAFWLTTRPSILSGKTALTHDEINAITSPLDKLGEAKQKASVAYTAFQKIVKEEYGTFTDKIFNKETIRRSFQGPSELSTQRLQRRILIKILESLLNDKEVIFNWVLAGHSSAAGHGNLFSQSYGYILEQSAKPVFEAIGIKFYGKNYAIGATKSAPESALCMSAIYGVDLDILSWDFAMTDGRGSKELYKIWTQRVGTHPTRPILISYAPKFSKGVHEDYEKAGMAVFDAVFVQDRKKEFIAGTFPNSDDEDVKVEELPRGVKYYRCNGHTEKFGELCGDDKYKWNTTGICNEEMRFQTKWHPGWKDHLLKGRVTAAFIIEHVLEALNVLVTGTDKSLSNDKESPTQPALSQGYLNHLYEMEEKDKQQFLASAIPKVKHFGGELEAYHDAFMRAHSICHYAYLPSFARYEGLVTENRQTLRYLGGGKYNYKDEGRNLYGENKYNSSLPEPTSRIVYNFRENRAVCSEAEIDFKDYFSIRHEEDWVKVLVPNDSENMALSTQDDWKKRLGLISLCEMFFIDEKFPANFVSIPDLILNSTKPTIFVNGVPVTNYTMIGTKHSVCYVLRNAHNHTFPSSAVHGPGRYEMEFEVPVQGGELYISSFIVI